LINVNYPNKWLNYQGLDEKIIKPTKKYGDNNYNFCNPNDFYFEVIPNFISNEKCDEIVEYCKKQKFNESLVAKDSEGYTSNKIRTSKSYQAEKDGDLFRDIQKKVSDKLKIGIEYQENPELLHYNKGNFFTGHYDESFWYTYLDKFTKKYEGSRIYTTFIYLNDVEEGGETSFNNLGIKVKPTKGTAIFWRNLDNKGTREHPCSYHEALKLLSDNKWALTIWTKSKKNDHYAKLKYKILKKFNLLYES
jgi:prolyl 4-hydroxylase